MFSILDITERARGQVVQDPAFQYDDCYVGENADQCEQKDGDKHHCRVSRSLAKHQQVSQADVAADHLADYNTDHR
mgnify:FL=1